MESRSISRVAVLLCLMRSFRIQVPSKPWYFTLQTLSGWRISSNFHPKLWGLWLDLQMVFAAPRCQVAWRKKTLTSLVNKALLTTTQIALEKLYLMWLQWLKRKRKKKGKRMWGRLFSTCDFTSYEKYVNHLWCQVFVLLVCGVVWCLKPPFLGTAKAATLGLLWFQHRRAKACHPARLFFLFFSFSPKLYGYNCN